MSVSIKQDYKIFGAQEEIVLKRQQNAVLTDVTSLNAALLALAVKLDADIAAGGASEVDYASTTAALQTATLVE